MHTGTVVSLDFTFVAPVDTPTVETSIKGIVRGRELPFPEKMKNPCDGLLTPGCPLVKGTEYSYSASFEVKPFYPPIPVEIKYGLTDAAGDLIACFQVASKLVDPNPKPKTRRGKKKND
ncbi:NPC intracellular cholesterol transporter 2 -like protein a [Halotydeus destructor]|nr:NPC intracellular cholesterol transporter 2 -like protein a [Halotydeus destructor]